MRLFNHIPISIMCKTAFTLYTYPCIGKVYILLATVQIYRIGTFSVAIFCIY